MKIKLLFIILSASLLCGFLIPGQASAADYGTVNIIDDAIMNNTTSMSAGQINSFLNGFTGTCLGTNSGFVTPDPLGYSSGAYQYGGNTDAGTAISHIATRYNLNPQVLIATLEKEQGLIDTTSCHPEYQGDAPAFYSWSRHQACSGNGNPYSDCVPVTCGSGTTYANCSYACRYSGGCAAVALGYSCPGFCKKSFANFSAQISGGSWVLRFSEARAYGQLTGYAGYDSGDEYIAYSGPMTQGYRQRVAGGSSIYYDGSYTDSDGNTMRIANGSTASMLSYTPFYARSYTNDKLFHSSFVRWFGATQVPTYSWSIVSVAYSTGTNSFGSGMAGTVTVQVKNTGTATWYNYGANPIRLGTWLPPDSKSPLYSPGWLSPNRLATMTDTQVNPQGTATFTFPIQSSGLGTYVLGLNLAVENSQWMPWPGLSPTINIVPAYMWQVESVSYGLGTGIMEPGTTQEVIVKAKNTGFATWSKTSGPPIRLATWAPGRVSQTYVQGDWLSQTRLADMEDDAVPPESVGTFKFNVRVPSSGLYYESVNLVAEGKAWFNNPGLTLYLEGGNYAWQPLWASYSSGGNANLPRGTQFTVTIKAKNTGKAPWRNDGGYRVMLATASPQNRGSALYTNSWINDTRPATLVEGVVQPGDEGTFRFTASVPQSPGPRFERFNLVATGVTWFNDPGFGLYINSL